MTSKEYVIWLKGFVEACHEYQPTPKQWDALKDKLAEVTDDVTVSPFPFGTPNTAPIMPLPYYPNPLDNPFKVTCDVTGSAGTWKPNFTVTTTPGTGFITIANPNLVSFGSGSTSTTTQWNPSGSTWHYTNGGNDIKD